MANQSYLFMKMLFILSHRWSLSVKIDEKTNSSSWYQILWTFAAVHVRYKHRSSLRHISLSLQFMFHLWFQALKDLQKHAVIHIAIRVMASLIENDIVKVGKSSQLEKRGFRSLHNLTWTCRWGHPASTLISFHDWS